MAHIDFIARLGVLAIRVCLVVEEGDVMIFQKHNLRPLGH